MDNQVLRVLDHIRDAGFEGIGGLLEAMMESQDATIKRRLRMLSESRTAERFIAKVLARGKLDLADDILDVLIAKMGSEAEAIRQDKKCHIAKKNCVPHGGLRWRPVGRVNAAWVPHGDHTQRLKRLKRLERRRNVMCVQNALNGGRTHISRARTMMHSERHARSDR
jgi:hypothetical protein